MSTANNHASPSEVSRVDFVGRLDAKHFDSKGATIPATLTKSGVFTYRNPDGTTRREFRSPEEVAKPESVKTLVGAPVVIGHPSMVTPANWRTLARGTVLSVTPTQTEGKDTRLDSDHVALNDAEVITRVDSGELVDVSCGYFCKLLPQKGEYNGQAYDYVQTDIRYNHVGLFAQGKGRQGQDVALRFDGLALDENYTPDMTLEELQKKYDALEGEYDALKAKVAKTDEARTDAAEVQAANQLADERMAERCGIVDQARAVNPKLAFVGKSNRDIMLETIAASDPKFTDLAKAKSDDYVRSRFDSVCADAPKQKETATAAALATTHVARVDSNAAPQAGHSAAADSLLVKAEQAMHERNAGAWKIENIPDTDIIRRK